MIARIIALNPAPKTRERVEIAVILDDLLYPGAVKPNPYATSELAVTAVLRAPNGRETAHSAFFTMAPLSDGSAPEPHFRFRFYFSEPGEWLLTVRTTPLVTKEETIKITVSMNEGQNRGIISVDPSNDRYFIDANGKSFIPVGCNLAWGRGDVLEDYRRWFAIMRENGMNLTRIWLAPWTFALHVDSPSDFTAALPRLDILDEVIEEAARNGIYLILVLLNHGQFATKVNPTWDRNPYNQILSRPEDFFIDQNTQNIYFDELRYIIARYGYAENLFAWEIFNEINHVDAYYVREAEITAWHEAVATFIKASDPYRHMVTTSYYTEFGPAFNLPAIDFVSAHSYDYANLDIFTVAPKKIKAVYESYRKPVLYAEFGISFRSGMETYSLDPDGRTITAGIWSNILGGGAGAAMPWWWDNYLDRFGLFVRFRGAGLLAPRLDFRGNPEPLSASVSHSALRIIGQRFPGRLYGYLYGRIITRKVEIVISDAEEIDNVEVFRAESGDFYRAFAFERSGSKIVLRLVSVREPLLIIATSMRQ